jgi:hypothetical protein
MPGPAHYPDVNENKIPLENGSIMEHPSAQQFRTNSRENTSKEMGTG